MSSPQKSSHWPTWPLPVRSEGLTITGRSACNYLPGRFATFRGFSMPAAPAASPARCSAETSRRRLPPQRLGHLSAHVRRLPPVRPHPRPRGRFQTHQKPAPRHAKKQGRHRPRRHPRSHPRKVGTLASSFIKERMAPEKTKRSRRHPRLRHLPLPLPHRFPRNSNTATNGAALFGVGINRPTSVPRASAASTSTSIRAKPHALSAPSAPSTRFNGPTR